MHDARLTHAQYRNAAACLVIGFTLFAGCGKSPASQSHADHEAAEKSLARAVDITARMLKVYREAGSYTDHATYVEESVLRGEGIPHEIPYYEISIAFHRPNKLRLLFTEAVADAGGERRGFDVACDGELLRATMPEVPDQMVEKPAPAALTAENVLADPLIEEKLVTRQLGDVFPQLAMLLNASDDDAAAIFPDDSSPRLLADATLGDRDYYRVATSHPEGTRIFWIDRETYVLRRMELPVENHRQRIDPDNYFLRLSIRIDFEEVTFNAEISPESFTLKPPAGSRRVRRFVPPAEKDSEGSTAKDAKVAKEEGEKVGAEKEKSDDGGDAELTDEGDGE